MMYSMYMSPKTIEIYERFKDQLKSDKAKKEYLYVINEFCDIYKIDFLRAEGYHFAEYMEGLASRKSKTGRAFSYKTQCFRMAVLNMFGRYIEENCRNHDIPSFKNKMAGIDKPVPGTALKKGEIPDLAMMKKIYEEAADDLMMTAIVKLVNKCALTTSQLCNLKLANFIQDENYACGMQFQYKGRPDRYLKMPDDVIIAVSAWIAERDVIMGNKKNDCDYVFINYRKGQLSSRSLQKKFQQVMDKVDPQCNCSLESIRNLSATLMLAGGAAEGDVAEYMGINTKWMSRYRGVVAQFQDAPCDHIA